MFNVQPGINSSYQLRHRGRSKRARMAYSEVITQPPDDMPVLRLRAKIAIPFLGIGSLSWTGAPDQPPVHLYKVSLFYLFGEPRETVDTALLDDAPLGKAVSWSGTDGLQ